MHSKQDVGIVQGSNKSLCHNVLALSITSPHHGLTSVFVYDKLNLFGFMESVGSWVIQHGTVAVRGLCG